MCTHLFSDEITFFPYKGRTRGSLDKLTNQKGKKTKFEVFEKKSTSPIKPSLVEA